MPRLARAEGGGDAFRDLNNALHELHALASWPSLDEICSYLKLEDARRRREGLDYARLVGISKVNVSRLFSAPKLPKPDLLLTVVEYLAKRAYRLDADKVCEHFDRLWRRALSEEVPPAPGPEGDDDWPDVGPNGARPRPRGPRPSGAPATGPDPREAQPSLLEIVDELRPSDPSVGRSPDSSARLLMVDLTRRREYSPARLTDRTIDGWSKALSMGSTTVVEQPTAANMRRLVAETLDQAVDTAVLWLRAPVIWDSETGEAHFVTRDSELDAHGTLWNTVSYTEIQYAVTRSAARAVLVVVLAGRSSLVADAYGGRTTIPVGKTQWVDTLYAHDDDLPTPAIRNRPVFLLWLRDAGNQLDYPAALWQEMQSSALPGSYLTTGALLSRLRTLAVRLGQPEPFGDARHGGEAIVIGQPSSIDDAARLRLVLRPSDDVYGASALDEPAAPPRYQTWEAGPELAGSMTVAAAGRVAGRDVVAAAFADNSVRLLDAKTGQLIQTAKRGYPDPVTALAIGTVAGNDVIAVARADDSLQLWDPHTGRHVQTLSHSIGPLVALAIWTVNDRDFIVAVNAEQMTWFWEVLQP